MSIIMFYIITLAFVYKIIYSKIKYNILWKDFNKIYKNKNISFILYYPYITCGYGNKIRVLISCIILSLVSFHPLYIINWPQLLLYFHLPKSMFIRYYNNANTNVYCINNICNTKILNLLKNNYTIKIYTIHRFTTSILHYYNLTNNLKFFVKEKQKEYITLDGLIYQKFFIPTKTITNYINNFKRHITKNFIVAAHIRTGYLSDFGEKDRRFYNNNSMDLYINTINRYIKSHVNSKVFIISDSSTIKNYFSNIYKKYLIKYSIPGKICHARRETMHGNMKLNECVVKLITENYLLSECNIIIGSIKSSYFELACNKSVAKCILM